MSNGYELQCVIASWCIVAVLVAAACFVVLFAASEAWDLYLQPLLLCLARNLVERPVLAVRAWWRPAPPPKPLALSAEDWGCIGRVCTAWWRSRR